MGTLDDARRASEAQARREWEKLVNNVNQLVRDMKDVKARLDRLDGGSDQSTEGATHPRQSDSVEQ